MKAPSVKTVRCAIYTRVSTEHGLDQEFNSLDAQYDAASAYIKSQAHAGWTLIRSRYDDGGYSGGSTDRPDLQKLLEDIRARKIDVIVVYKVDRLTRSLNIGQPAVSKAVVQLEEWLGVSLLMRSTRSSTEAGRIFYERAKRMIEEANGAVVAARGKASGLSGKLRVSTAICFGRLHLIRFRRCRFSC